MPNLLEKKLNQRLQMHAEQGLTRSLNPMQIQGALATVQGKHVVQFASNDYLNLANDADIKSTFTTALNHLSLGAGASHLISGHHSAHEELEQALAEFMGYPRAILCSTGYMANLALVCALLNKGDAIVQDKLNHASLMDAALLASAQNQITHLRYQHLSGASLNQQLMRIDTERAKLVVTDGLFSMDGNMAPLPELSTICQLHQATLAIDDAHGIGVLGEHGRGCVEQCALAPQQVPLVMGTLGKAFGGFGAFIVGSNIFIESILQFGRSYIYTTASPPALAKAHLTALDKIKNQTWRRAHLQDMIQLFRTQAKKHGIALQLNEESEHARTGFKSPIQPVLMPRSAQNDNTAVLSVSQKLLDLGFYVPAIRPPTTPTPRLRVTLSAAHTKEQVIALVSALKQAMSLT